MTDAELTNIRAVHRACLLAAENADLRRLVRVLAERVADQSEILSRAAERAGGTEGVSDEPRPIDVMLFCPSCGWQHIDAPEPEKGWANPPHKSHLCHVCGTVWRPADVPTNGVAVAETRGKADTWPPHLSPPT